MRYYHPAVLNVLGSLFFHKGGYGKQELPYGGTMKENIPKAAVAWVAAGVCCIVMTADGRSIGL